MRIISLIIITMLFSACNKPDPQPELKDPIYQDLISSLSNTKQTLEKEKKDYEGFQQALKDVIPQTGQIKYAQKRVYESQARISRLEQEIQYLELKIMARQESARDSYTKAFKRKESWPNPIEWESYKVEKRLRAANRNWDYKDRIDTMKKEKSPEITLEGSHQ